MISRPQFIGFIVVCLFSIMACNTGPASLIDPELNAREFCGCADKAATLILKMKSAERMDTILYNSVNSSIEEMELCMSSLAQIEEKAEAIDKLSDADKTSYEEAYYSTLDRVCPNVTKAFNSLEDSHVH